MVWPTLKRFANVLADDLQGACMVRLGVTGGVSGAHETAHNDGFIGSVFGIHRQHVFEQARRDFL